MKARTVMNGAIRYVAEPNHVREVSLLGTADVAFWTTRLRGENLLPKTRGDRAQVLIVAAEMTFMGIRFTEVSFSVLVTMPGHERRDAVFLVHAFTSSKLFCLCEHLLFATPYSHAECRVSASDCASIRIIEGGEAVFRAEMPAGIGAAREPSRRGKDGWEGLVFLPGSRRGRGGNARLFFGKMTGYTQAYPFVPAADDLSIKPSRDTEILQTLLDSGFIGEEWRVRTDATHGKSKSYRRCEVLGGRFMATPANAQFIAGVSGREVHSTKWSGEISAKIGTVMDWRPRLAQESDVPGLEALIPASARALLATHYSPAQIEAALGPIFGVDQQLIHDGTYFVSERDGVIVGCGGWSRRRSLYGGDSGRGQEDALLDPQRDAARVRAFFVHPSWARRGIGRSIMKACEQAIIEAGFPMVEIVATLAGEPLYAAFGYAVVERYEIVMAGGLGLPVVRMAKTLKG